MELVKGEFFEVSGINCSIENPSFVTAVISAAQFRFSRPCVDILVAPSGGHSLVLDVSLI
jgi:ribosomal protein S27E